MKCNNILFIICFFLSYTIMCDSSKSAPIIIKNYITMPSSAISSYGKKCFLLCSVWEMFARCVLKNSEWGCGSFAMKHIGTPAFNYLQKKDCLKIFFNFLQTYVSFSQFFPSHSLRNTEGDDNLKNQYEKLQQQINQMQHDFAKEKQTLKNKYKEEIKELKDNLQKNQQELAEINQKNNDQVNQVNQEKEDLIKKNKEIQAQLIQLQAELQEKESQFQIQKKKFESEQNKWEQELKTKDDALLELRTQKTQIESSFDKQLEEKVKEKTMLLDHQIVQLHTKNQELLNQLNSKDLKEKEIAAQLKKQVLENNNFESAYQEVIKKQAFELFNKVWTKQVQQVMPQVAALESFITNDQFNNYESFVSLLKPLIHDLKMIATSSFIMPRPKL